MYGSRETIGYHLHDEKHHDGVRDWLKIECSRPVTNWIENQSEDNWRHFLDHNDYFLGMTELNEVTHKRFQVNSNQMGWWGIINLLRKHLGDNDPLLSRTKRKWFTSENYVWIRIDCLKDPFVTWFVLRYT